MLWQVLWQVAAVEQLFGGEYSQLQQQKVVSGFSKKLEYFSQIFNFKKYKRQFTEQWTFQSQKLPNWYVYF